MLGFFVYHSHFKLGKIVGYQGGEFQVLFVAEPPLTEPRETPFHLFSKDALKDGDLLRAYLPLGGNCTLGPEQCVVEKIAVPIRDMKPARYTVVRPDGLRKEVSEAELFPSASCSLCDPLIMLASGQPEGYPLFRAREQLAEAHADWARDGGGLQALLSSRIDLRPHQAYVAGVVLQDRLRRYLLADEVGLGKTVETGIVIQDFLSSRADVRVLVLCPGALTQQWLCELYAKFGALVFTMLELHVAPDALGVEQQRRVLAPFHLASGPIRDWLIGGRWDLVVIDEVHHILASPPLYALAAELSRRTPALLLLSALPAQKRKDEFLRLLALLEPDRYTHPPEEFDVLYDAQPDISRRLRRLRRALLAGNNSPDEVVELARSVAALPALAGDPTVQASFQALASSASGFVNRAWVFLHEAADRARINRRVLRNRRQRLVEEGQLEGVQRQYSPHPYPVSQLELEAAAAVAELARLARESGLEENAWFALVRILVQALAEPQATAELLTRFRQVTAVPSGASGGGVLALGHLAGAARWPEYRDGLLALARRYLPVEAVRDAHAAAQRWARAPDGFTRYGALVDFLQSKSGRSKLLVFAGFSGIATRLTERLRGDLGADAVVEFREELSRAEKEENVRRFRADATWVMVSDETGGEGRNFQFAQAVLHFDTPWHASRVEQRIGRLDRLGRTQGDVVSHVFFPLGTAEADLLRCYAEGFGVYTQSISGLEFALRELEGRMVQQLLGNGPIEIEPFLGELREQVEEERARDETEAALDEASFDRVAAERYRRGSRMPELELALETAFTRYAHITANNSSARAWDDKEFPAGVWRLSADEFRHVHVNVPDAPRDGEGRSTWLGTFRRAIAQERLDLNFFTVGHPLFDAVVGSLAHRRAYAIDVLVGSAAPWVGIEFVFVARPDYAALGDNRGLLNRARQFLNARPLHLFVQRDGRLADDPEADHLLSLRRGLDADPDKKTWANLTKLRVDRLQSAFVGADWRDSVYALYAKAQAEARGRFEEHLQATVEAEATRLREQVRQAEATHSADRDGLHALLTALTGWVLELDGIGFLSVNGNLLGR